MPGSRSRANRAVDGGQAQGGSMRGIIADEIRRALFSGSRYQGSAHRNSSASGQRREEWTCPKCKTPNVLDRVVCRRCEPAGQAPRPSRSPTGTTATPPRPRAPAPKLGAMAAAAAAAGASPAAVAVLRDEAAAKREERTTPGGKLDTATAKLTHATRRAEQAREALAAVTQRVAEAEVAKATAEEDVRRVQAELAKPPASVAEASELVVGIRKLLDALEMRACGLPEEVVDMMAQLHSLTGTAAQAEAMEDEMRDTGVEDSDALLFSEAAPSAMSDLSGLGAMELENRLEACHNQHKEALASKQWAAAAALGGSMNRLTDALQGLAAAAGA